VKYPFLIETLLALTIASVSASAQTGRTADINYITWKLQTVYAGYGDKVDEDDFQQVVKQVRGSKATDDFFVLSRLTGYFKDDHVALFTKVQFGVSDSAEAANNLALIQQAKPMQAMLDDPGSGYWVDDQGYQILYIRPTGPNRWEGDIVETRDPVPRGLKVLVLYRQNNGGWLADFTDVGSSERVIVPVNFKTPSVLVGRSFFKYRQLRQYQPGMLAGIAAFSFEPSAVRLDSQTLVIHMPYFEQSYVAFYDSLVKANAEALQQVSTLILDIRGNSGGSLRCLAPLMPYVCTSTMQGADVDQLCSADVIAEAQRSLAAYSRDGDTARMRWQRRYIDSLGRHQGHFWLHPGVDAPCTAVGNSILHVGVLMDHGSRSAAELMVLYLRQSTKVRLFGEASGGAVDYSDLLGYELPQTHFKLWVASSRRVQTAWEPAYDATGIQPNVEIPDTEPDWIGFVRKYYK
jgi:Peptidase family S41